MDISLYNVIILSFAFFFTEAAYVSVFNAQKYVIESIKKEDPSYNGDSYIALCITYALFSLFICVAPPIIRAAGPRPVIVGGTLLNVCYIAQFLYPIGWVLYFSSVVSGIVGALVWNAQGYYLTENSTKVTVTRNSSILWGIMQSGVIFGNAYILITIRKNEMDKNDRYLLFGFMAGMVLVSFVITFFLREAPHGVTNKLTPSKIFINTIKILFTVDMLLLSVTFFYVGIESSFYIGVYSSALGFMEVFHMDATVLISLSGILIGVGEVIGGIIFGVLSSKFASVWRHYIVVVIGFVTHVIAYIIIMLIIADSATNGPTRQETYMEPNITLALFCAVLLGFADACYLTQIYGFLGKKYKKESTEAHALLWLVQTAGSSIAFFYTHIGLYKVLYILLIFAVLGTITFVVVDIKFRMQKVLDESLEEAPGATQTDAHEESAQVSMGSYRSFYL